MKIYGILEKKLDEVKGTSAAGNPYYFAQYLFVIPGQYVKHVCFQVSNGISGRIGIFDRYIGKNVCVHFDISAECAATTGRWYNRIQAYSIAETVPGSSAEVMDSTAASSPSSTYEPLLGFDTPYP